MTAMQWNPLHAKRAEMFANTKPFYMLWNPFGTFLFLILETSIGASSRGDSAQRCTPQKNFELHHI